jgi:uncharacterized protein YbaR (Trm112 family)
LFIELTDHLRCPADHAESFLVLIPDEMAGRMVRSGVLGCPVCQRRFPIMGRVVHFGTVPELPLVPATRGPMDAAAIAAFLGLEGPGGYVGLIGDAAQYAEGLAGLWPGVHLVAVNPPAVTVPSERLSVLRSPALPLKARSLRGIVIGDPFGPLAAWRDGGVGAVLPGLRATGRGPVPSGEAFELLGQAEGWWVGRCG